MKTLSKKALSLEGSKTLILSARAKKMKAEGIDVVSLTAGEPDFPTPETVKEAGIRAIRENFTYYTANQGIPELLKAIAEKFRRDNNLNFEPSQILVSCGAKHSIFNALQAICNPGDEVLIPAPYWVSYPEMVRLVDGKPVIIKTSVKNQFKMTPKDLKKAIRKNTKALVLSTPCNPTGAVYSEEEQRGLCEVIAKAGIYVISDEIYEKVIFDGMKHFSMGSIEAIRDQAITVNGVSKAYSMTGWRIGYMGARKDIIEAAGRVQSQVTSNANSIAQKAAYAALSSHLDGEVAAMAHEFDKRRQYLLREFQGIQGVDYVYPRGAFFLFFDVGTYLGKSANGTKLKTSDDICEYLLVKHNVAMVPGASFGARQWVRLSYACSMQDLEKGVLRIKAGLGALS